MVGHFRGGLAHVNVVANLIFSGMSGSAVADAAGPGLIVARMMMRDGRYPAGFAAATSVVSATIGPLVPPSIPMIFYALIANASVGALFLAGLFPALLIAGALMSRDRVHRAPARLSRGAAGAVARDPADLPRGAAAACAARHPARHHLHRHRDADRGRGDRRRLRAGAGLRDLPLDHASRSSAASSSKR